MWKQSMIPQMKTEISSEGLTNALLTASKAEEQKRFDLEVIVWFHLLAQQVDYPGALKNSAYHIHHLFSVMELPISVSLFKKGVRDYRSDEVPTEFQRNLYRQFLRWKQLPKNKKKKYTEVEAYKEAEDAASEVYKK